MQRIGRRLCLGVAAFVLAGCGWSNGSRALRGSGSSFVKPIMDKWIDVYTEEKGGDINYQKSGSTAGIRQMIDQAVDFGCTDAFMTKEQLETAKKHGEVIHIPLVMGAIVPAYNLKGLDKPINFSGDVLAEIFLGKITKWNDPALKKINEGVALPDLDIAVVHRTEGSGSTFIFTKYLHTVSSAWRDSGVGFSTAIKWKCGVGEEGNSGIAGFLGKTEGSIGYMELYFALLKKDEVQYGAVRNQSGKYILASLDSVTKAADNALKDKERITDDLNINLLDVPGEESYSISGTTWAVFYANQEPATGKALHDFFHWVTHEGQKYNEEKKYARLPEALLERVDKQLAKIKH